MLVDFRRRPRSPLQLIALFRPAACHGSLAPLPRALAPAAVYRIARFPALRRLVDAPLPVPRSAADCHRRARQGRLEGALGRQLRAEAAGHLQEREGECGRGHPGDGRWPAGGGARHHAAAEPGQGPQGPRAPAQPHRRLGGQHRGRGGAPDEGGLPLHARRDPAGRGRLQGHFHSPQGERCHAQVRRGRPHRAGAGTSGGDRRVRSAREGLE